MKKTINQYIISAILCIAFFGVFACSADKETPQNLSVGSLTVDKNKVEFPSTESNADIKIETDVTAWLLSSSDASWLKISQAGGTAGTINVKITALVNTGNSQRTAIITLSSNQAKSIQITVTQAANTAVPGLFPDYNTNPLAADASGMGSNATQLAAKMNLGWNIGNTLEATGSETAWGNPKVTKALIDLVKANGFNAIRIPCSWNQYLENASTAKINTQWLDRVKEVVQYCVDNDMYVIVNIHWDGGWLENNVTDAKKEENNAKQKAFWQQIATHLRGFDEHLLFASANEPNVENAAQMAVLTSYHQTFIDAVRSTGGKNAYRNLIVQGPSTDIEKTNLLMTSLPTDSATNRMMAEVHFYPYQFTLMTEDADWGKMFYYWGAGNHSTTDTERNATWGEEADIDRFFLMMKTQFVDKGIPVILGEFGAIKRDLTGDALTLHLKSRAAFLKYVVKQSRANGMVPFYWDAGNLGANTMSLFDRSNNTVYDSQALEALLEGLE
ncbi:cellulase family glycosylhydrolase [Flavobacterium sp. GA093]|uniref:Cellulase family glycosylhydrolase n=1 Tax=Flavobacterium hydrocarbonoxydans TaxID=2683249 RepID=A0A6I4NI06_9FLAO|nr:cellulase family glycosylhydrolase [Flavobacterium hydrocarbonoxydans]MWB93583.1 cellulase family glycosylhydrolase [Flavobacterium hydrocarbonoxydans]